MAAAMSAGLVLFALGFAMVTRDQPALALAVPAVLGTAALCTRWPATAITAMLVLSGAYGSLQAFGVLAAGPVVDLLIAALWTSVLISHAINGRERPWWIWPGVAILFLYIGITFLETATAASFGIGIKSFRYTTWYMLAVPLLALAGWRLGTYLRISRALIAVALLVAGYAVLRQLIGPAQSEEELAQQSAGAFNTIGGDLSLIGSFPNRHGLAFWVTCAAPFCLAATLIDRRMLWKLAAAVTVGLCLAAAYATDVRAALPALVAGGATVVVLNQLSAGARGTALAQTIGAVAIAALAGSVLFAVVVGPDSSRYGALLSPSGDQSYEQHVYKWGAALDEIEGHPFGNGLGTAGRIAEQGLGPYVTAATYAIDSSYLKIAFEQGFPLLALFVAAMITLLVELARRAVRARSPGVRALAIGAAGTMVAALAMFVTGQYMEDVGALILWIPVGAAIGAIGAERAGGVLPSEQSPPPVAEAASPAA
jgi:O-antigen ligase